VSFFSFSGVSGDDADVVGDGIVGTFGASTSSGKWSVNLPGTTLSPGNDSTEFSGCGDGLGVRTTAEPSFGKQYFNGLFHSFSFTTLTLLVRQADMHVSKRSEFD